MYNFIRPWKHLLCVNCAGHEIQREREKEHCTPGSGFLDACSMYVRYKYVTYNYKKNTTHSKIERGRKEILMQPGRNKERS